MATTVLDIVGRVAAKCDLARTDAVREYGIVKILKLEHQQLSIIAPALVRDYKTALSDPLTITGPAPVLNSKVGAIGSVDISTVKIGGVESAIVELHSVANSDLSAPYGRVQGLEHISNLGISDESGAVGRFWWPTLANKTLNLYRGSQVLDTHVVLGFTSDFDTSYADLLVLHQLDTIVFDCPPQLIGYLVVQTALRVLEDFRMKIPEHLGREVQDQRQIIQGADANLAAQMMAMERRGGSDSIR